MPKTSRSSEFDDVVRQHLPVLDEGQPISADASLANFGLDSLRTVSLLIAIEDRFEVTFPDELLAGNAFDTIDTLWSAFQNVLAAVGA